MYYHLFFHATASFFHLVYEILFYRKLVLLLGYLMICACLFSKQILKIISNFLVKVFSWLLLFWSSIFLELIFVYLVSIKLNFSHISYFPDGKFPSICPCTNFLNFWTFILDPLTCASFNFYTVIVCFYYF